MGLFDFLHREKETSWQSVIAPYQSGPMTIAKQLLNVEDNDLSLSTSMRVLEQHIRVSRSTPSRSNARGNSHMMFTNNLGFFGYHLHLDLLYLHPISTTTEIG